MDKAERKRRGEEAEAEFVAGLLSSGTKTWRNELDGGIVQEGTTLNGRPHGILRQWFPNGQLRLEWPYQNGELHGLCRQYTPEGKLVAEFTMSEGDGILLECWDTGVLKIRWWQFHAGGKPCHMMELLDIDGKGPVRGYMWKGGPCRTKKRFLGELAKCGLVLPASGKINDPATWAAFARKARRSSKT